MNKPSSWWSGLPAFGDLRFAFKSLRRSPGFTLIAVLTLGLGIGANTAAFSILNAILLRPLPYPDSGQLERIFRRTPQSARGSVSTADFLDLRAAREGYAELASYGPLDMTVSEPGQPAEVAPGLRVSANLFDTLRLAPELGRAFRPDEETAGNHRVLVISRRFWTKRFGADPGVIGRQIRVDGEPYQVVGVMPAAFNDWRHLGNFDLFRPLGLSAREKADRATPWLRLLGRRAPDVAPARSSAFVAAFGRKLAAEFPALHAGTSWRTLSIYEAVPPEGAKAVLGMLIGLSGMVLLIACSNLANLLLARTVARARELAVRAALGASRVKLLRPLLAESLLLALAGGVCAVQFAVWANDGLNRFADSASGEPLVFHPLDWRVLSWAFGACLLTAVVFGVVPALFAFRLDLNDTLKSGARGMSGDRGHRRFRNGLVAAQFALAMVLLAGAALFRRGLDDWNNRGFGWEAQNLVTGTLQLLPASYPGGRQITDFQRRAVQRLEALPGAVSASISSATPFFAVPEVRKLVVQGRPVPEPGREPAASVNAVSPRYFETIGTSLLDGRAFEDSDGPDAPRVAVVNQTMARTLFPGESALGRRVARAGAEAPEWVEIVGVAADVEPAAAERTPVTFQLYVPFAQEPRPSLALAVRGSGAAPSALVEAVRTAVMALDPELPVRNLQPAAATIALGTKYQQIIGVLLTFLAGLGLGLACLGLYGVIARTTAQRTGEFGIRLALGARAADITRLVLTSGAKLALLGSAVGLLGALGVTRLIAAGFPGLKTESAPVLAAVTLVLLGIAQLACYVPARMAARISPAEALRSE